MSLWVNANYKGMPGPYPLRLGAYANFKYEVLSKTTQTFFTLSFVKNYLKVTQPEDDELIAFLINSAIKFAENWMKKDLTLTQWLTYRDFFGMDFFLKRSPFVSLQSIEYLINGVWTLVDSSIYYVYLQAPYSSIVLQDNKSWPNNFDNILACIRITFTDGFEDVPFDIQNALLAHISYLYQNRGDCDCSNVTDNSVPIQSKQVYDSYRTQEGIIYRQSL